MSFTGGGIGRRGACKTKKAYRTKAQAEAGIRWMAEHLGSYAPGMEAVSCPYKACGLWHVKHKISKDRKGKRWS